MREPLIPIRDRLRAAVDVRRGEGWPLAFLIMQAWCMGISNTYLDAAATSLFLSHFAIDRLPWVYIASAITGVSIGFVISRLEPRVSPAVLLGGTITMLVASIALMYAAVVQADTPWLGVLLMMWKDVQYILSAMSLWAAAGMLFDLRQGKRLFGIVGAGDITAIISGGLTVPLIAAAFGAKHLLGVAMLAQAGSLVMFSVTMRRHGGRDIATAPEEPIRERRATRGGMLTMLRDPFLRPLFLISVVSYLGYYFVDYGFYARVQVMYPTAEAVAAFYGYFLAATGVVNLLSNLFLSGRILTRYGVQAALLVLPALVGIGAGLTIASIALGIGALLVWSVIATKLVDEVFRKSIEGPTYRVLYQPLRRADRLRVQAMRESVVEPFAIGMAGVVLLVLIHVLKIPATSLVWGVAGIVVVWLALARSLGRGYVATLRAAIGRRKISHADAGLDNETTRRLLREYLDSAMGAELVYALRVLESSDAPDFDRRVVAALAHEDAVVREFAIGAVTRRRVKKAEDPLRTLVAADPSPALRGSAAIALCAICGAAAADCIVPLLEDTAPEVRRGAIIGLLRYTNDAEGGPGRHALERHRKSADASDRLIAARVLRDAYSPELHEALVTLLADGDALVAKAALLAAGASGDGRFVSFLLLQLEGATRRPVAAAAIISLGPAAVDSLSVVLREPNTSRVVRRQAARILGRIASPAALRTLVRAMDDEDAAQRGAVATALELSKWRATGDDRARVLALLGREATELSALYAVLASADDPDLAAFRDAVVRETMAGRSRILSLLTLLLGDQAARDAKAALASGIAERRAQGLEMIETLLPRALRRTIIPLLDDLPAADRVRRLEFLIGPNPPTAWERVNEIVCGSGADGRVWLRAVAIRTAALRRAPGLADDISAARDDREPLIRETVAWAEDLLATSPSQ